MKLWLLRALDNLPRDRDPWREAHGRVFGFVIRAETEEEARQIASWHRGAEDRSRWMDDPSVWQNPKLTTCTELMPDGDAGLVMRSGEDET